MTEQEYSLKESFKKIGILPGTQILVDQNGNIIDGVHSEIAARALGLEIPKATVNIKNPAQTAIMKLVRNKCRRDMEPSEITQCLDVIGRHLGWKAKDFLEKLPFTYSWLMKYLPDRYKDPVKAKAGAVGGQAKAEAYRKAKDAIQRQPISEDTRQPETSEELTETQETVESDTALTEALKEPMETEKEFAERFANTFKSHIHVLNQVLEKDFPTIIGHMSEKHICDKCVMQETCSDFLKFLTSCIKLKTQLPICMQQKIT